MCLHIVPNLFHLMANKCSLESFQRETQKMKRDL